MARDLDDMTDGATTHENRHTERARRRAIEGDAPPTAESIGDAVAKALERQRDQPPVKEKPLPEIVRASVRCGYETTRRVMSDGSSQMVTSPASVTFKAHETADGKEYTVPHGRPIQLKREAFQRYAGDGKVILAQ